MIHCLGLARTPAPPSRPRRRSSSTLVTATARRCAAPAITTTRSRRCSRASALRKHIFALFAFARVADDFADEQAFEGRCSRELDRWEEHARRYRGHADHPVFVALGDTVDKFGRC